VLDVIAADCELVGAGCAIAGAGTGEAIGAAFRVARPTHPAFHQAGEQMTRTLVLPEICLLSIRPGRTRHLGLSCLDGFPELLRYDAKLWHVLNDPRVGRVEARLALPGIGVLHILEAVPYELADVELVIENASATAGIAIDGGGPPSSS